MSFACFCLFSCDSSHFQLSFKFLHYFVKTALWLLLLGCWLLYIYSMKQLNISKMKKVKRVAPTDYEQVIKVSDLKFSWMQRLANACIKEHGFYSFIDTSTGKNVKTIIFE